jgi:galactokinase
MIENFQRLYGSAEGLRVYRAPGRVNLIGEHTDYNLGFVLPVALQLATTVGTAPARDGKLRIHSEHLNETREFAISEIPRLRPARHWTDYAIGVAQQLIAEDFSIDPANLLIHSTVPEGSGLSSSAALEVSCALAFLNGRPLPPLEVARLCQRAEVNFVGMPCGIMDQYISVYGREGVAVEIDCRSLEGRDVTLPAGIRFLAVNSMVKHALAGSAYKERVQECAAAVERIQQQFRLVESLRDVSLNAFESVAATLPDVIRRRARHIVTENVRVNSFADAASRSELAAMGRLMLESHRSLRHDYEVSCAELDFLVDTARAIDGVYGSRMTGGGFGGCTVTMLVPDSVDRFRTGITAAYERQFHVTPQIYECRPSNGAGPVAAS